MIETEIPHHGVRLLTAHTLGTEHVFIPNLYPQMACLLKLLSNINLIVKMVPTEPQLGTKAKVMVPH